MLLSDTWSFRSNGRRRSVFPTSPLLPLRSNYRYSLDFQSIKESRLLLCHLGNVELNAGSALKSRMQMECIQWLHSKRFELYSISLEIYNPQLSCLHLAVFPAYGVVYRQRKLLISNSYFCFFSRLYVTLLSVLHLFGISLGHEEMPVQRSSHVLTALAFGVLSLELIPPNPKP